MADPIEPQPDHSLDAPFSIDQLFYSRTDKRGVIASGNALFQTISGFAWDRLIGAPHKIIRNMETPRSVFRIMWDHLQNDRAVVAYVRNKTEDGRGYWVIALIMPLESGYLSVRIKPTSPLFDDVKRIYADLALAERDGGISVEDSTDQMLAALKKLGFADYTAFMMEAFSQEFKLRSLGLSPKLKGYFADIERIKTALGLIEKSQSELLGAVESLRDLPTNMRIVASRLEPSGGPLSAMSDIYNSTSSVLFREITEFALGQNSISKRMIGSFEKSCFMRNASLLLQEAVAAAAQDDLNDFGIDTQIEADHLQDLVTSYETQDRESLQQAERLAQEMNRASYDLRRSMLGLDTIRVMGLVESGRLGPEGNRIGATMDQIGQCHDSIVTLLQRIKDNAGIVNAGVTGLRMHKQKPAAIAAQ